MKRFLSLYIFISIALAGLFLISTHSHADGSDHDLNAGKISTNTSAEIIPVYTYKVVNIYPHDSEAYTQGLVFQDGILYEGTGLRGRSSLRRVELETGVILKILRLPDHIFGEGVAVYKDNLVQLTWDSKTGFVYDKNSFALLQKFSYSTQGWGITSDGERLIMSDGSSIVRFLDPETYNIIGQIQVHCEKGPVEKLNELE
ncbi:MAG: glutaminyl-peptide cyclotransferase, partial [Deltaproteobacteria bacterium]|nr:glutaminyl-peptide cyclotransferase [Deltaproteobacteria bacterium]